MIEAKAGYRSAHDGVQQAKEYAEVLGVRFAYASNGRDIIEIDLALGTEVQRTDFPTPGELWSRVETRLEISGDRASKLLSASFPDPERPLRYYQEIAVNRAMEAILGTAPRPAAGRRKLMQLAM